MKDLVYYLRIGIVSLLFLFQLRLDLRGQEIGGRGKDVAAGQWADSIMAGMSLKEKIAQLFMVAAYSDRDSTHNREIASLVQDHGIGGLIFFQGAPVAQTRLLNQYQSISKVPLWVAMDAEWGLGMRLDSTMSFPYQMTLGAIQDDKLILEMGKAIGRHFRKSGMHINYAPVLDVNNNSANPVINFRSFGDDKENVARKGIAYMRGLHQSGVFATGKHFPGHGDTQVDSHHDLPILDFKWQRLDTMELFPFKTAINEGMMGVMVAHLEMPELEKTKNLPSTLSRRIVNGVLRDSLGFEGLVFTDALNMEGVTKYFKPGEIELLALEAGNDLLVFPQDVEIAIDAIYGKIRNGEMQSSIVNDRCRRILRMKYLLDANTKSIAIKDMYEALNNRTDEMLNRRLHREAITVISNENDLLPLKRLDTLNLATINIGTGRGSIFQERLSKYTKIHHYYLKKNLAKEDVNRVLESLNSYNVVILNIDSLSKWPGKDYGVTGEMKSVIAHITSSIPTILVWLNSPYGLVNIEGIEDAAAVIVTYQENDLMKDFSAQIIFGGISAKGKLPVTVSDRFATGTGIDTEGGIRFRYSLPEEIGLKGNFLYGKIDSLAKIALTNQVAPGLQVLVARNQEVVLHETYGYHTYDSITEVKHDDIYDLASVSKITSALPALMALHDQNKFSLDATLGTYLDEFQKGNKKDIQLRRILSHNAQLEAWIPYWQTTIKKNGKFKKKTLARAESPDYSIELTDSLYLYNDYKKQIYKMIRKSELLPEEDYVYSGLSFYLYPDIVSNLTNSDFESHLKSTFYKPLGAYTITYNPYKHFSLDRIIPTEVDTFFRMEVLHGKVHDEGAAMMDGISSNAGLFASTNDLAKLMQMYLNMGVYGGQRFISSNTLEKFTFCHYCEEGNRRGLAFDKPVLKNKEEGSTAIEASASSFGHSGYTGTFTWADPDTGILFVFMSNRVHPTRENRKLYQLNIRPKMHQVIYDARIDR